MKPWEQQPGESSQAHRAARLYFEMGPTRTLVRVSQAMEGPEKAQDGPVLAPNGPSGSVKRWAKRFRWKERAQAWDANLDAVGDRAREAERANQAAILEQRRAAVAETEWKLSQALWLRIGQMLQHPVTRTTTETTVSEDGRTTIVHHHHPTGWRLRDLAALARVASDLQRLAAGMPTRVAVPTNQPGDVSPPVDQAQADADNDRIPGWAASAWLQLMAGKALEHEGLADAQPDF